MQEFKTVAELLEDPARWTQGDFARMYDDTPTGITDQSACQFCLLGAIWRIYKSCTPAAYNAANKVHALIPPKLGLMAWNDDHVRTHAEVIDVVRRAGI